MAAFAVGNVAQRSKNIDVIHCTIKYVIKVSTSTTWGLLVILPTGMFLGHYQIWKEAEKARVWHLSKMDIKSQPGENSCQH